MKKYILFAAFLVCAVIMGSACSRSQEQGVEVGRVASNGATASYIHYGPDRSWTAQIRSESNSLLADLGSEFQLYNGLAAPKGQHAFLVHHLPTYQPVILVFKGNDPAFEVCDYPSLTKDFRWGVRVSGEQKAPFIFAFDTAKRRHVSYPYKWAAQASCPEIDTQKASVTRIRGSSQIDVFQSATLVLGHWYVGAGNELKKYDPFKNTWENEKSLEGYTLQSVSEASGSLSLLVRKNSLSGKAYKPSSAGRWAQYIQAERPRLQTLPYVPAKISSPTGESVPLTQNAQLPRMLVSALEHIDPTGFLDYANNNSEGRISWRQMYLTTLYLDMLEYPGSFSALKALDSDSFEKIETRLRIEWENFVSMQCRPNLENYYTPRYALNRQPFHSAVNIGRIAEVFGRYEVVSRTQLPENCWEPLIPRLTTLEETWDEIAVSGPRYSKYTPNGTRFLRRRKGVEFARDGNNIPFNHVSAWITGLLWAEAAGRIELTSDLKSVISDEWNIFFAYADMPKINMDEFSWLYAWGPSFEGWSEETAISFNSPTFKGNKYRAGLGYLMMDSQALLGTEARLPESTGTEVSNFRSLFEAAFQSGALGSHGFRHMSDWSRYGLNLTIPDPAVLLHVLRPTEIHEVRGSFWAAAAWVNHSYGGEDFVPVSGHSPYLSSERLHRKGTPGTKISLLELLGNEHLVDYEAGDKIEIFDAHCGRGYFQYGSKILLDRNGVTFPVGDLPRISYHLAPVHNGYDEIRFRLKNRFGETPWRTMIMTAKGSPVDGGKDSSRMGWKNIDNNCVEP